jgi:hypothetical protein
VSGNADHRRQLWGRFRDVFVHLRHGGPRQALGAFAYFTAPPRRPSDPATQETVRRYGIEGRVRWNGCLINAVLAYGTNSDPKGTGVRGTLRGGFLEVDRMVLPSLGVTGRWEAQGASAGSKTVYSQATTLGFRYYPGDQLRLSAEYQWRDHDRSTLALLATLAF